MKLSSTVSFLLALLLSANIVSCGTGTQHGANTSGSDDVTTEPESTTEPVDPASVLELPDSDFKGREFRVLGNEGSYPQWNNFEIYAESENGDVVNDAVFRRNRAVEDRYNVKVTQIIQNSGGDQDACLVPHIRQTVMAGDDLYDLAFTTISGIGTLAREGLVYDLNGVRNIDFSKNWWNQDVNETLSIGGRLYFTSSDFSLRDKSRAYILAFNKEMINQNNLDDPVSLVRENKWTIDKFSEMVTQVAVDLNGDGKVDDKDQFGVGTDSYNAFATFIYGCGVTAVGKDENDVPILTLNSDRTVSAIDKVRSFFTLKNVTVIPDQWQGKVDYDYWSVSSKGFKEGRTLFTTSFPHSLKGYSSDCVNDYGIIPYPKFDESQEKHYTYADRYSMLFCIPASCADPDFAGFMLEALSAEATDTSLKAYYEISCKTKYTYDADSAEMLDLTFDGIQYDLTRIYSISGVNDILYKLASKKDNTFSSDYAKIESKAQADIEKLIEDLNG